MLEPALAAPQYPSGKQVQRALGVGLYPGQQGLLTGRRRVFLGAAGEVEHA